MPAARSDGTRSESTCYAVSNDGIHWTRPNLGLFEYEGSKDNNIVLGDMPPYSHNFCPMIDPRDDIPADERYKMCAGNAVKLYGLN